MRSPVITFVTFGAAKPKGAVRPVPITKGGTVIGSRLADDSSSRPWAALVQDAARQACKANGFDGVLPFPAGEPVEVRLSFYLPRPQSLPKRRPSAPIGARSGDADKLSRAAFDALTGIVWADDSQVVLWHGTKAYCEPDGNPRLVTTICGVDLTLPPFSLSILRPGDRTQ